MAKDNKSKKDSTTAVKTKRPKTAAQIEKKRKNEACAAARLLVLQQEQAALNAIRAEFPGQALSDDACRNIIEERRARRVLDGLLACDMVVGGEPISKRIVRFLGKDRLKGIANGDIAVRDVIFTVWRYAATQHEMLLPVEE